MRKLLWIIGIALLVFVGYFLFSRYLVSKLNGTGIMLGASRADEQPVSIVFIGDMMLDRTVRTSIERSGLSALVERVTPAFGDADLVVGNLEGAVTSHASVSQRDFDILRFTFDPSVLLELKALGFSGFSQANNHALDFGQEGFLETQANIAQAGLFSFGSPLNDLSLSSVREVHSERVCFVGYMSLYRESTKPVQDEIVRIKPECTYVVVVAHWGTEYETSETAAQKREAHELIDVGADLIIGAHPHVIEPIEIYKDKAIFYSLGNFIFDQDFSLATRQGLVVRLELSSSTQRFQLVGIEMQRNKLYFPEKEAFQTRTDILASQLPRDLARTVDVDSVFTLPR